ncbi:Rpn family recombination-promoting nuclease/putative transposase [Bullifex porci]|uniref:Rpn family recombination-promoting nuclease/putative transposase n=1 Tax=Bullifex porci TaxID=2606638 RepID=UPI0023F42183|nr:Rpn family recombination-promoting nuclease/putative transposase [Bullifex porci]MDD7587863.1 Rpn family recombination-promoting nuclease/putative transposase [Bullifex porci]
MAKEKDRAAKNFFSDPKIFSEFVNLSLFNGEERIKAEDLREIDPVNSTVFTKNKSLEVLVDNLYDSTVKESDENVYAIIGLESQAYSDKHMVIRAGIASLLIYDNQIATIKEGEKLKPVYIIVFNMLDRKWSNATDLRKLLSDEAIKVFGYPLVNAGYYVLDPHELKGEKINKISKPLKLVLNIIKNQGDKKELLSYINSEEAFKNLDYKTAKLLETIMKVDIPNDGGYNMCKAIEDIKNDGRFEGKSETLYELTHDGVITKEIAAKKLNITVEKFEKDMKAYFNK